MNDRAYWMVRDQSECIDEIERLREALESIVNTEWACLIDSQQIFILKDIAKTALEL